MVTGIHVLEHLPFPVLVRLLDETLRALRPGGVAVFETPNPQNVIVGATYFRCDPTHVLPLHPDVLRFTMERRGFVEIEVVGQRGSRPVTTLDSLPEGHPLASAFNPVTDLLRTHFAAAWDYAIIARRPRR
jgi:O-antigen chain-terminating methyltransferase